MLGQWLLEQEKTLCSELIPDGYYPSTLQVGMAHVDLLDQTETGARFLVDVDSDRSQADAIAPPSVVRSLAGTGGPERSVHRVVASATALPFGHRSHSMIVLPHQLDFCADPHAVLREINQILIPEGCVVVSGFNRLSLWGAGGMWRRRYKRAPWSGRYCRPGQIQDWLSLLGYDVVGARQLAYGPAMQSEKWRNRFSFMEKAGDRWWPALGAAYVVVGRKREIAVLPGNRRRAWQQFIPAIARPAVQSGSMRQDDGKHPQPLRLVADND